MCGWPVRRVLSRDRGPPGWPFIWGACRQTPRAINPVGGAETPCPACAARPTLFDLAAGGACRAAPVARGAVGSYPTVSPLPRVPAKPAPRGGLFSVALSLGSPQPGVTRRRFSMLPGRSSPRGHKARGAAIQPSAARCYRVAGAGASFPPAEERVAEHIYGSKTGEICSIVRYPARWRGRGGAGAPSRISGRDRSCAPGRRLHGRQYFRGLRSTAFEYRG